jgi:hypothetical protein
MPRRAFAAAAVLAALLAAGSASAGRAAAPTCGSYSVGPGAHTAGSVKNARCLLNQFTRCRSATYRLSTFGVDTIAVDDFSVSNADGHCFVSVQTSFRVVPQQAKPGATAFCASLKARGADVVAVNCTGGTLPKTISLTGKK